MRVAKWGNSLAVRLPKALVEKLGLRAGDTIEVVSADPGRIAVYRSDARATAIARMRGRLRLPEGYRFDRENANAR